MTAPSSRTGATDREVEAVALAIWEFEAKGEADPATLDRLWPKMCRWFPGDAASYRAQATAAIAALDDHRAALLAEQPGGGR